MKTPGSSETSIPVSKTNCLFPEEVNIIFMRNYNSVAKVGDNTNKRILTGNLSSKFPLNVSRMTSGGG
jgi:hypothetical protein